MKSRLGGYNHPIGQIEERQARSSRDETDNDINSIHEEEYEQSVDVGQGSRILPGRSQVQWIYNIEESEEDYSGSEELPEPDGGLLNMRSQINEAHYHTMTEDVVLDEQAFTEFEEENNERHWSNMTIVNGELVERRVSSSESES